MTSWQLQEAKNRFSAVVEAALTGEPQEVTRRGKPVVVILAFEEYQRLREAKAGDTPSFVDHLMSIPKGTDEDGFELPERTKDYTSKSVEI